MAKGAVAKEEIIKKILETFEGSFKYDKEVRIPFIENGEEVQIKVAFTCAKVNVEAGGGAPAAKETVALDTTSREITKEEKKEVDELINRLNL